MSFYYHSSYINNVFDSVTDSSTLGRVRLSFFATLYFIRDRRWGGLSGFRKYSTPKRLSSWSLGTAVVIVSLWLLRFVLNGDGGSSDGDLRSLNYRSCRRGLPSWVGVTSNSPARRVYDGRLITNSISLPLTRLALCNERCFF